MARFVPNQPITTREPTIVVDAGLPVGRHRFRLVVVDGAGRQSTPQDAIVDIQREQRPSGLIAVGPGRPGGPAAPDPEPDPGFDPGSRPRRPTRRRREKP